MKKMVILFTFISLFILVFSETIIFSMNKERYSIDNISGYYKVKTNNLEYTEKDGYYLFNGDIFTNTIGLPKLPAIRFVVYSYEENLSPQNIILNNPKVISLQKSVYPVQKPRSKQTDTVKFEINEEFYNSGKRFPSDNVNIIKAGKERERNIYIIEVFPFIYDSKTMSVFVYDEIEFEIDKEIILSQAEWDDVPSKYLITTKSSLLSSITNFIDFKRREGFFVEIIDIDTIGATNIAIKSAIQSVYDTSSIPLRFILLAGDVDIIPHFVGTEENYPSTDLYYSLLSGDDYMPDVYVGRFPSSDTTYLKIMSDKTIMFEKAEWLSGDVWVENAYLIASDDPTFHLLAESTQIYVAQKLRGLGMTVDSFFAYNSSGTPVATAINSGKSNVVYSGHGSNTSWLGPEFTQIDINNLLNQDMIPFVSSYACLTGDYSLLSDCFGETWVKAQNKGSVSYMGSSVYSYWDEDDYMERRFFDAMADSEIFFIGKLMNKGKLGVYTAYSGEGYSKRYYEMYNILGDPSLALYTQIKDSLLINVLSVIPEALSNIEITISEKLTSLPVRNALVSLSLNGNLNSVSYTDSTGKVLFANPGMDGDTLYFMATKPNYRYDETISIISSSLFFPYVVQREFADTIFSINTANYDFSPLDYGTFNIFVTNFGEDTIISLVCSLSTSNSHLQFLSNSIDFPDTIADSDTFWGNIPVEASVNSGLKNNTGDTIVIKFSDINDSIVISRI
ncbi:MAG: hypothetical protein COX48_03860, partial [bacterium (Candidatus Stahlbacteria) CG23_combo_of_CG06-09_8_20_14_all_34_7]